jgi:pimeloyl-ACP methyl ester carboxylesterase
VAAEWSLDRDGVRLAGVDYGGGGPAVLLLHGLAGNADEWAPTAAALTGRAHVVAFDARGHGASEPRPPDVSPQAHVADAAFVIEQRGLAPATVIGQSYGALTAFLLAAERPDLVERLVVAEASPGAGDVETVSDFERALRENPTAEWAKGVAHVDVLVDTLRAASDEDRWAIWARIRCPTLVVRGEHGDVSRDEAQRMVDALGDARLEEIPQAGHNVHLDQPERWNAALAEFHPPV